MLTEDQLNDVTQYLDDQNRLTRVQLIGVGIVDGLRVSLVGNSIRVGKGLGVTTDGDILGLSPPNTDKLEDWEHR